MQPDPCFWRGRTVCVTGGTGFLGYHIVRALGQAGARIRVFALPPPPDHPIRQLPQTEIVAGDVLDPAAVRTAVAGCSIVIHSAGIVSVWGKSLEKIWPVHVDGTRNVLDALDAGARLIHTSSIVAVGASRKRRLLNEESPFNLGKLKLAYVQAKRAAEELALSVCLPPLRFGEGGRGGGVMGGDDHETSPPNPLSATERGSKADVVVVNPGYLIGPEDFDRSVMGQLCHRFWRGRAPVAPPGGLNFVDVRDVALGHLLAAERGVRGRRYILGGDNLDYKEFFQELANVARFRPRWIPRIPRPVFTAAAAVNELRGRIRGKEPYPSLAHARLNRYFWFVSSVRARHELGWEPLSVCDSLTDAYAWYAAREQFRVRGFNRWLLRPPT